MPQDREGRFSTELFERYQRSEKALVAAWRRCTCRASRPGRSRRSPKSCAVTPSRPRRSAQSTSAGRRALAAFAGRRLEEPLPLPDPRCPLREGARGRDRSAAGRCWSRSASTGTDGGRFWRSSWPTARAGRAGRTSCSACRRAGLHGVEFVVVDDHAGLKARDPRGAARGGLASAATCTSSATRSTTCRARPTTTACRSCAGSTTGATSPRPRRISPPGSAKWQAKLPEALRLGRGEHRGDASPTTGCRGSTTST